MLTNLCAFIISFDVSVMRPLFLREPEPDRLPLMNKSCLTLEQISTFSISMFDYNWMWNCIGKGAIYWLIPSGLYRGSRLPASHALTKCWNLISAYWWRAVGLGRAAIAACYYSGSMVDEEKPVHAVYYVGQRRKCFMAGGILTACDGWLLRKIVIFRNVFKNQRGQPLLEDSLQYLKLPLSR